MSIVSNYRIPLPEWRYRVESEDYYHSDFGKYHTYGIQVTSNNYAEILHDVSVCRKTVDCMVELFNHHQLSPVHLHDTVVEMLL